MEADKPIFTKVMETRAMWRELWWIMANGVKSEYERIKGTDVIEFYALLDLRNKQIARETENLKASTHRK